MLLGVWAVTARLCQHSAVVHFCWRQHQAVQSEPQLNPEPLPSPANQVKVDDAARVLIDADGSGTMQWVLYCDFGTCKSNGGIALDKGYRRVEVHYVEYTGDAYVSLQWDAGASQVGVCHAVVCKVLLLQGAVVCCMVLCCHVVAVLLCS